MNPAFNINTGRTCATPNRNAPVEVEPRASHCNAEILIHQKSNLNLKLNLFQSAAIRDKQHKTENKTFNYLYTCLVWILRPDVKRSVPLCSAHSQGKRSGKRDPLL